jgi:hypothetical protein
MEMRKGIDRRHVVLGSAVGIAASSLTALAQETQSTEGHRMADENANDEVVKEKIRREAWAPRPLPPSVADLVQLGKDFV